MIDHYFRKLCFILTLAGMVLCLAGCGSKRLDMPFFGDRQDDSSIFAGEDEFKSEPFSEKLCLVSDNNGSMAKEGEDVTYAAAGLFCESSGETIYAQDVFKRQYPASMTKVLTAICAMKYGNPEDEVKCSDSVYITESGAQLFGLDAGDRLTLDAAMHALLMYSANDAAVAIAESISGSVEEFADLMNSEAKLLGCQNTHFVNPHGLHDEDHYTCAYDMYLMFNEAVKYDWFIKLISADSYSTTYTAADGSTKEMDLKVTNYYIRGDVKPPEGVRVVGGKTGTTMAAGNNLILYSKDSTGKAYISIVMRARQRDFLYKWMNRLLEMETAG